MKQGRTRRANRTAAALVSRRQLQVERLEWRSMLAADVDVADSGVPGAVDERAEDVPAFACELIACEFLLAAESCVLIEPERTVDAGITTDPPELWVPIAFDPEAWEAGGETEALDGRSDDLQQPVSGDSEAGDSGDGDFVPDESCVPADPSTDEADASAAVIGEPEDAESIDVTEEALPEGVSLMICPGVIDPPVLLFEDPNLGDWTDAVDVSIDVTGVLDSMTGDGDLVERAVFEPRFGAIEHVFSPIRFFCRGGIAPSEMIAMSDAGPTEEPVFAVTAVADDDVAEPITATESTAVEQAVVVAMASSTTSASLTAAPAVAAGPSDAARLFAAYAAGLGQVGADPQSLAGIGGRRSGRRAN